MCIHRYVSVTVLLLNFYSSPRRASGRSFTLFAAQGALLGLVLPVDAPGGPVPKHSYTILSLIR